MAVLSTRGWQVQVVEHRRTDLRQLSGREVSHSAAEFWCNKGGQEADGGKGVTVVPSRGSDPTTCPNERLDVVQAQICHTASLQSITLARDDAIPPAIRSL